MKREIDQTRGMTPETLTGCLALEIIKCRNRLGWTQAKLAAEMGITQTALSRYENGKITINVSQLFAIAEALGEKPSTLAQRAQATADTLGILPNERGRGKPRGRAVNAGVTTIAETERKQ